MNNNNNNISGMVKDVLLIESLKSLVRDVVREELQANGYVVRSDSQFMPNYDPGNMMMQQNIMSKTTTMPGGTSVNDVCIDYRRRNLKHCNTCFAGNTCLARFETKTFDVDEFNRRYSGTILEGMTVRQFLNLPEVIKFKGNRTDADIISVIFFKNSNTFVSNKDIKDDVVLMDLFVSYVVTRSFPDNKIVIYVNVTGFTKDDVAEPICINTSHDCNTCSVVNTCPIKKAETKEEDKPVSITKEEPKGKKYKELKEFGLFDLMPNGFNLYLDDDDIVGEEDTLKAQFDYDIDSIGTGTGDRYILKSNSNITITSDELQECTVTYISSDLTDFSVPALWIKPSEEWYKKFEYAKLADKKNDKPYRFSENEVKSLVIDAMSNVKSKRQHRRKSTK